MLTTGISANVGALMRIVDLQIVVRLGEQDALNGGVEGSVKAADVDEQNLVLFSKVKQFLIDFRHQVLVEQFEVSHLASISFILSLKI
jgi:hypothetical protein